MPPHTEPIKEPFASEIRDKLYRYSHGMFTEEELQKMKRMKEISSKYNAVWVVDKKIINTNKEEQ